MGIRYSSTSVPHIRLAQIHLTYVTTPITVAPANHADSIIKSKGGSNHGVDTNNYMFYCVVPICIWFLDCV
jgi:hypothetical protein